MAINQIPDPCMCLRVRSLIKESAQNIMNNVNKELQTVVQKYTQNIVNNVMNKELQTVVQKYTQNIVNNVNEDAFEK